MEAIASARRASGTGASPTSRTSPRSPAARSSAEEAGLTLEHVEPSPSGRARRVIVTEDSTTFIEGAGTPRRVEARLHEIRVELERATHERDVDVAAASAWRGCRAGSPSSASAAPTDVELKERMRRTEGSLAATQAAMAEGFVAGRRHRAAARRPALDDARRRGRPRAGVDVVRSVLSEPLYWIASNAGYDGHAVSTRSGRCPTATA